MILSEGNLIKINENIFQVVKIVSEEIADDDSDEPADLVSDCQEILLCLKSSNAGKATHVLKIYYDDKTTAHLMEIEKEELEYEGEEEEIFNLVNEKIFDVEDIEILY